MNYEAIVDRIARLKSDELDEWESDFVNDMIIKNNLENLSDGQKKKILEINRKYLKYS